MAAAREGNPPAVALSAPEATSIEVANVDSMLRIVSDLTALHAVWEREPLVSDGLGDFGDVFSVEAAQDLIASNLPLSAVRLFLDGKPIESPRYARPRNPSARGSDVFADPHAVLDYVGRGATVALEELQMYSPAIASFAADVERDTGYRADCTGFLTPAGASGVLPHYDALSVVIRQVRGAKRWRISEPAQQWPIRRFQLGDETGTRQVLDVTLEEGQSLYLPRGFIHAGTTQARSSAHLTIGLHGRTWAELLREALAAAADGREELREAVPPAFSPLDREQLLDERARLLAELLAKLRWTDIEPGGVWAAVRRPPPPGTLGALLSDIGDRAVRPERSSS
jgi:hypothetical protein